MAERPQYLKQEPYCLSTNEAEKILSLFLHKFGNIDSKILKQKNKKNITVENPIGVVKRFSYMELLAELRNTGVSSFFQETIDQTDEIFGRSFTFSHNMPNIATTLQWAGYEKIMTGISRIVPSEVDLSGDIEFYKFETCIESNDIGLEMCSRNYRGYLFSCIALIDSFINKHVLYYKHKGLNTETFNELSESQNCEQRIELFVKLFCNFSFATLKKNRAWTDFMKIKTNRNEVVHSLNPYFGIEIKELANNLNLSIHGVGSLLKFLQEGQGRACLGFIEKIRTSKIIYYNEVYEVSTDRFTEKRFENNFNRNLKLE